MAALERRLPDRMAPVRAAIGDAPERLRNLAGLAGIRDLGVDRAVLEACADAAAERPELHLTPPAATRDELLELYEAAW
jgi:alcohol dehydrogenase class IV